VSNPIGEGENALLVNGLWVHFWGVVRLDWIDLGDVQFAELNPLGTGRRNNKLEEKGDRASRGVIIKR
jgi:hypothetical protein